MYTFVYRSIVVITLIFGILLNLAVVFKLPAIQSGIAQSEEIAKLAQFIPYYFFTLSAMGIFILGWSCGVLYQYYKKTLLLKTVAKERKK